MRTLAISLILACFVQTALARMPATAIVRPASELVLRNNSFAVELLRIVASNKTPQWNPTLLNNIPNFASATEEGYIPTITEREELLIELEKFDIKDIDVAELRSAYDKTVEKGLGLALHNGTALEIVGNVSEEYTVAVVEYASLLALEIQKEGIKVIPVAIAELIGEGDIQFLEGSLAAGRDSGHAAMQTGEAMDALLGKYTQETEVNEANTENIELGELTTSTGEKLPAAAMEFGLLLEEVRVRNSLSKSKFCTKLGIGPSACRDYVTFQRVPRLNTLSSKIIPALTSLGVDEKAVRSAWERADAAFTAVATTKPTPTEIAPTESVPAEELEADGLTLKQLISQHREILQQKEQQQQRGEVSEAMVQIVRDALTGLEELLAIQVEAVAQLKDKMAMENIGWEEIAKYRATGLTSRLSVKDMIGEVSNDPRHADMYAQLLAGLAENSEQAEILLEQYFSGERVLSEEELVQVCLHTACTVAVRPTLAVERVLDLSKEVTDKIGVTDELSKEELEVLVAALAVYQGKYQVTAEVQEEVVPTVQEEVAPPVQEEVVPTVQEQTAQEKAVVEAEAAEQREAEDKRVAEQGGKQKAQEGNEKRRLEKEERVAAEQKQRSYEAMAETLLDISKTHDAASNKTTTTRLEFVKTLTDMGFASVKQDGANHPSMVTKGNNTVNIPNVHKGERGAGLKKTILKQARSIRLMEELNKWEDDKGDWTAKRDELLTSYLEDRHNELSDGSREKRDLNRLIKALKEMETSPN